MGRLWCDLGLTTDVGTAMIGAEVFLRSTPTAAACDAFAKNTSTISSVLPWHMATLTQRYIVQSQIPLGHGIANYFV